jgi:hypothetical protein
MTQYERRQQAREAVSHFRDEARETARRAIGERGLYDLDRCGLVVIHARHLDHMTVAAADLGFTPPVEEPLAEDLPPTIEVLVGVGGRHRTASAGPAVVEEAPHGEADTQEDEEAVNRFQA